MCSSSPPPTPDYRAAAAETSAGNAQQALIAQYGSMTNQVTPQGKVTYDPRIGGYLDANNNPITNEVYAALDEAGKAGYKPLNQWTQTATLSKEQQALFDQNQSLNQQLGDVAQTGVKYVANAMDNPLTQKIPLHAYVPTTSERMTASTAAPNLQTQIADAGKIRGEVPFSGAMQQQIVGSGPIQSSVANNANQINTNFADRANQVNTTFANNAPQVNTNFANNAANVRTSTVDPTLLNKQVQDALYRSQTQYLDPQFEQSSSNLQNQLANQGITQGSAAYNRAMLNAGNQKQQAYSNAQQNAITGGVSAANTLFGQNLAGANLNNAAVAQQFGQGMTSQQAGNAALAQQFGQGLAAQQAGNTAVGQQFGQGLAAQQAANAAVAQQFGQGMTSQQAANTAVGQQFGQGLAAQQAGNAALGQQFGQNVTAGNFANTAQGQQFSQNAAKMAAFNAAQAQQYSQNANDLGIANAAQAQQYGQNASNMAAANAANTGMFGMAQSNAALNNATQNQVFAQNTTNANLANQASNQQLAQDQTIMNAPVNMLNAVRSSQQMQVAQQPQVGVSSPAALNQVAGPDYLGATNAQFTAQSNNANAANAASSQLIGSLIGGAGAIGGGFAARSDIRLKKNIIKLGVHKTLGIGLYTWDYLWGQKGAGVMAQELEKVMPEAVFTMPDGFKAVNYLMLGA